MSAAPSPTGRAGVAVTAVAAVVVAVGGFAVGRGLTAHEPIARNQRPAVDGDRVQQILADGLYENHGGAITQDEADCAGGATVDAIGPQRIVDLGLGGINPYGGFSYAELTVDEEPAFLTGFLGCIPDERMAAYRTSILAQNIGLDRDSAACIAEAELAAVGAARLRELLVAASRHPDATLAIVAQPDEFDALVDVTATCGVAEQVHTTAVV